MKLFLLPVALFFSAVSYGQYYYNDVIANIDGVLEAIADILQQEKHPQPILGVGEDRPLAAPGVG